MKIHVNATGNMAPLQREFVKTQATAEALNASMARIATTPEGYRAVSNAVGQSSLAFRDALGASKAFKVETIKVNDAVSRNTELMQKQKLSYSKVFGKDNKKMMKAMYREQLAMQHMFAQTTSGGIGDGSTRATLAIPTEVHKSWDTLSNRVGFYGHQLASVSQQTVNWGKNQQWAGRQLMTGISMPVAAFGAAAGVMAYKADKEFTRIQKVYDTTADASSRSAAEQMAVQRELDQLRVDGSKTAVDAAHRYGASLTDTLSVQAELAATGQRGAALQKGTNEVMRIAMLGEIDQGVTTKALISLQSILGLTTKETADAFNYLNSIENATSLSMADFAEAIPRALGPMKEMGGDLQDLGILMVALKERGFEAGESANSIKALQQRIFRPSPQIKKEWMDSMGINLDELISSKDGNIMEILPAISDAVRDLSRPEKNKALAGLFGTYQVGRMNAMLAGIDNMNAGIGQTSDALRINKQSWQEWSSVADKELEKAAQSASGKFKRALEGLKAEMSVIGVPFLEVASTFLTAVTKVAAFFNSMPSWAKKGAIFLAIFAALVGPVVMLVGLFANFAGNIGKFTAFLLKATSAFNLFNKAELATKLSTNLASKGLIDQATSTQLLTGNVEKLTLALQHQSNAAAKALNITPPYAMAASRGLKDTDVMSANLPPNTQTQNQELFYQTDYKDKKKNGSSYYRDPVLGTNMSNAKRQELATVKAINIEEKERGRLLGTNTTNAERSEKAYDKMRGNAGLAAVGTATMATAMGVAMFSSNETANNIANMAMLGTIVLPAAVLLAKALKSSAIWAGVTATKMHSAASGAVLAQGGAAGLAATLKGGALGAMKSLVTKTGLLGLAVGAVAVGGFLVYKHWKKGEDALDEQIRKTRVLNNGTQDYADSIGKAVKEYAKIKLPTIPKAPLENPTAVETATKYFAEDQKGIDFQKSFEKNDNQQAAATQNYVESIELLGRTTSEAKAQLIALYQSIGMPQDRAIDKANEIAAAIGKAGDIDWATAVIEQSELFTAAINNMLEDGDKESKIAANEIGETFARQFGAGIAAGDKDQIKQMIEQISQMTIGGFEKMYDQILALGPESKEMLSGLDVDNAQELSDQLKIIEDTDLENLTEKQLELQSLMTSMGLDGTVKNLQEFSAQVYKSIEDYSGLQGEILNQTDVELNFTIAALTMTGAEADKYVKDIGAKLDNAIDPVQGLLGSRSYNPNANSTYTDEASARFKEVEEQTALTAINSFNQARGLKQGATHGESLWYYTMKIKAESQDTAKETGKIKDNLNGIEKNQDIRYDVKFGKVKMAAIRKQGMEGLTDDVSEELTSAFDDSMSAALESSQAGWDARSDALDRRQEDETDRFEARWERRKNAVEKLYARRIDNIDKVIEAEQKADEIRERIFEAERTRIERLNESANRSIDFNLALQTGDLDEAARLRNDMEAQAQEWALADAEASAGRKSGKKTDRLENQKDNLEKMQDQEMDALEKTEERQRKHLDRTQEAQKDSLDKQSEANMKYLNEQWKNEKELFDDKIELFKSMPAANERELLKALKQSGLSLKGFGTNTLNPESERWGRFVQTSLVKHIRKAGNNIAKDAMWEKLGRRSAMQTLRGMGFGSMPAFKKFLETGELPSNFGNLKPLTKPGDIPRNGQNTTSENRMGGDQGANARHEGGWIGPGAGSRKGVARTVKGVGPGERMVLARDNEFMVNEHSAKKHSGILNEINNGTFNPNSRRNTGDGVGGGGFGGALGGIVSAALNVGLAQGVGKAFQNAFAVKQQQIAASSMGMSGGTFTAGAGGMYSDRAFSSEQLKNAGIIASVGSSMGMSARDLMIGIMTAITESGLVNVDYGDRDSLGLFQQRPSQGWGTPAQVTDPEYASKKFFEGLKGLGGGRNSMTPWAAAQAVQRSAYADGSNYLQYWDNAQAIFKDGLERTKSGNGQMIYAPGQGGWSKASIPGKGWRNTHDYANGIGSPLFAVNDGRIIESRAITSGGSPGNGEYATPYRSYGETVLLQLADGTKVRYAHLDPNTRIGTGPVKGGTLIGKSGNTGNSSGPHTHFDINGDYNASGWFQKHGIGLKTGGYTKTDGMANLHKDEVVVSPKMTAKLYQGIEAMPKKKKSGVAKDWTSGMGYSDAWTWLSGIRDFVAKSTRGRGQDESVNGSTNVKTGTYNVLYKSSNSATQTDLKKLMPKTDILSLTEMANKKRGLIPWIKEQGWGYFGPGQRGNETGIAWNNRKYDFEKGGIKTLNPTKWGRNGWDELREATYALLRNKQTNQQLWQISAHTAGRTQGRMASAEGIMQQQYNSLNTLIKDLNKTGKPVFLAGDLNTKPEKHNYKYNFAGLTDTKSGLLDRILGPDGAKLLGQRKIGGLSSDHQALLASFNIPSLAKGAENIRWDNTLINAHKGESVLTKDLSDKFKRGVDNFASGGNSEYNVKVYVTEPSASADQIANKVMLKLKQEEARKPIKRRSQ